LRRVRRAIRRIPRRTRPRPAPAGGRARWPSGPTARARGSAGEPCPDTLSTMSSASSAPLLPIANTVGRRYSRPLGDLRHGRRGPALLDEQVPGGLQDGPAGLPRGGLPARGPIPGCRPARAMSAESATMSSSPTPSRPSTSAATMPVRGNARPKSLVRTPCPRICHPSFSSCRRRPVPSRRSFTQATRPRGPALTSSRARGPMFAYRVAGMVGLG
jgi:hypothetical protein